MANNLDSFSGENVNNARKLLAEAKNLLSREEEIIEKVLKNEEAIGKIRVGYLQEFLGLYKTLDDSIARKTSELNDFYLIMDKKATESLAATKELEKSINNAGGSNGRGSSGGGGTGGGGPAGGGRKVDQTISDEQREAMRKSAEADIRSSASKYLAFLSQNEEDRANILEKHEKQLTRQTEGEEKRKSEFTERYAQIRENRLAEQAKKVQGIEESIMDLANMRLNKEAEIEAKVTDIQLNKQQEMLKAELEAENFINGLADELKYAKEHSKEAGAMRAQQHKAQQDLKPAQELEKQMAEMRAKLEYQARRKYNGILREQDAAAIEEQIAKEYEMRLENLDSMSKEHFKQEQKDKGKQNRQMLDEAVTTKLSKENNLVDRIQTIGSLFEGTSLTDKIVGGFQVAIATISTLAQQLEKRIDEIASYKGAIDTRLQGSNHNKQSGGSYWDQLVKDMTSVGAITPYFKQEDFANNIKKLVEQGIAFDLTQRAFLMTIQEKIATTFEVANDTLLRLIRIQQEDSTAGRLGMESALNAFLNEMYENTEYLKTVASSVRTSLEEMQSLMSGAEATEVEFQVQKWLGSLYSVGMSQESTSGIASALGQIAAGQIEGLTNGGAGNLLIMAANDAGLSIADILTDGINASDTNKLLQAAVNYLAELSESAKDNKVVQQQLANVFGVKASDLKAATNLVLPGSINAISAKDMSYEGMLGQLFNMAGSMHKRTSLAQMLTNIWENAQYSAAGGIASDPAAYLIYKVAKLLDDTAGGIDLPFINVMGFGVDLNTTVSDLMRVASVGIGLLGSLGPMISGLSNSFSGASMLEQLGIKSGSGLAVTPRGSGSDGGVGAAGGSVSESGAVAGNSSGSDVKDSTIQEANDSKKQQMIEAKEEEEENQVDVLNDTVIKIFELLDDVANGKSTFSVKVEGYGLTKSNSGGAIGGLGALDDTASGGGIGRSNSGGSGNGSTVAGGSSSISGNVSLGGWTTSG